MSQAINQEPIQWCYEARAHKNDNFASILVSEVSAEDDVTVAKIIKTQQFDWTMESHTQDVRGGEEPVYFEEDHILSTHCESLRKKNNSLLPKGGQGNSSTIASPDLGGISLTSILTHQMAIHFLGHLPQDNSHSKWKNSGHTITCNKSRGRGCGVGRQRTELLRTYSCYKATSEKNWSIKN